MKIPPGQGRTAENDDEALRARRQEIRAMLRDGKTLKVTPKGSITPDPREIGIVVPEGKLAISFYWYESDAALYRAEIDAMRKYFPSFQMEIQSDGRIAWLGQVTPGLDRITPTTYTLQAVYEHSHPSNDSFGGSIKVYSVNPDLRELVGGRPIPHTLFDSQRELYICTARRQDVRVDLEVGGTVTTAAVAISWAVKWLSVFELWHCNQITTAEFASHSY